MYACRAEHFSVTVLKFHFFVQPTDCYGVLSLDPNPRNRFTV